MKDSSSRRRGLNKAEFGRLVGVDRGTVHRWETGQTRPDDGQRAQTADVTGTLWEKTPAGHWQLLASFAGTGFKEYTSLTTVKPQ